MIGDPCMALRGRAKASGDLGDLGLAPLRLKDPSAQHDFIGLGQQRFVEGEYGLVFNLNRDWALGWVPAKANARVHAEIAGTT